jgi:hypothetical protein
MAQVAEIFLIEAPAEAVAGNRVDIRVHIESKASTWAGIKVGGALEYGGYYWSGLVFPNDWANFQPGQSYYFDGYFTMPQENVKVHVYSYYYADGYWLLDDEKTKDIKLAALAPSFSEFKITDYRTV